MNFLELEYTKMKKSALGSRIEGYMSGGQTQGSLLVHKYNDIFLCLELTM